MRARCSRNPNHALFIAPATVREHWVVYANGEFVGEWNPADPRGAKQPLVPPPVDGSEEWRCHTCTSRGDAHTVTFEVG